MAIGKDVSEAMIDIDLLKNQCDLGDEKACATLGAEYERGVNVPKNLTHAIRYYKSAAAKGELVSCLNLGRLLYTLEDFSQASLWLHQSLPLAHPRTYSLLGFLYQTGQGVEKDINKAVELFHSGARLNDGDCMLNLSWIYRSKEYGQHDETLADEWLHKACLVDHPVAWFEFGQLIDSGKEFPYKLGRLSSIDCYTKSAEHGFVGALEVLAEAYAFGLYDLEQDLRLANDYIQLARNRDSDRIHALLSLVGAPDSDRETVNKKMFDVLLNKAKQGHTHAQYLLSQLFSKGIGVAPSTEQSMRWLASASKGGHPLASNLFKRQKVSQKPEK